MKRYLKRVILGTLILAVLIAVYNFNDGFGVKKHFVEDNFLLETTFVRVVDGDTIVVELNGENIKVRFIGVDAPESVHSDESKNTEEGEFAAKYLESILNGKDTLYIQYDVEQSDVYGRTLAYVWISDKVDITCDTDVENYMLNAMLVKAGVAKAADYPPNTRYQYIFHALQE